MTIPLACVAAAFALIWLPRGFVIVAMMRQPEGFDNKHPRDQQARLTGWGRRAQAAHMNAFEAFAPFAAAVLVAHATEADPAWTSGLSIAFVVARTLYPFFYIGNLDKPRSAAWIVGIAATAGIFLLPFFR